LNLFYLDIDYLRHGAQTVRGRSLRPGQVGAASFAGRKC